MSKFLKHRRIIILVFSVLFFVSVIALTNDYFVNLESRNTILITLLIIQFTMIIINWIISRKEIKDQRLQK